jgi:abnormal spindle-like microcephaly-associated protein
LLLSYNPLWLHIGLETVFGEILPVENLSDIVGISQFILTRLLSNPDILEQFAHPTGSVKSKIYQHCPSLNI